MATSPVSAVSASNAGTSSSASTSGTNGLDFNSLLKIILTQLTYQDPLKPMDNFEFVSQLAQFTQIEQGQTMTTDLQAVASAQAVLQATAILGKTVDVSSSNTTLTGTVSAISLSSGAPTITIKTTDGQTVSSLALSSVTQVR